MPHDRYGDRRAFNLLTGHQRTPWSALDAKRRRIRYAQAVRAFDNGVLKNHPGRFAEFAKAQKALDAYQTSPRRKDRKRRVSTSRLPWIFGRSGRDRVLICLATNGAMSVRELSRAIGSDSHKTWDMVERLRLAGLVVKRDHSGGRKYVGLNRQLPIYRALLRLLFALDKHWPAQRINRTIARWHMPFDRNLTTQRTDHIFQSPVRSRVLLFISAVGETDMQTIYKLLGLGAVSTMLIVNHWEKQGIVRSRWFKRHRLVSLDPNFIVAKEIRALLREIVARSDEYRSLRQVARRRLKIVPSAASER